MSSFGPNCSALCGASSRTGSVLGRSSLSGRLLARALDLEMTDQKVVDNRQRCSDQDIEPQTELKDHICVELTIVYCLLNVKESGQMSDVRCPSVTP